MVGALEERKPSENEQQAIDAQNYYFPGVQQRIGADEQERQRALSYFTKPFVWKMW